MKWLLSLMKVILARRSLVLGLILVAGLAAQKKDRLAGPIDRRRMVALAGSRRPGLQPQSDRGRVDPSFQINQITLAFKLSDSQQADIQRLLANQQDRSSPDYRHWLSPNEYADRFGLSSNDLAQVRAWLESGGFRVDYVPTSRNFLVFSGTAQQVQAAFATEIHFYQVDGELHFANAADLSVPSDLAPLVTGVQGLDDFHPKPASRQIRFVPEFTDPRTGNHYLSPDDYATIYDLAPLYSAGYNGTGQKIVIAGRCTIGLSDVEVFRTFSGLPANDPQLVLVPGSPDPGNSNTGDCIEAYLDVEWAGAVARNATVVYVYGMNVIAAVWYAISQNLAAVVSLSFGGCEQKQSASGLTLFEQMAQQANAQGITWIAASGDSGAAGCDMSFSALATQGLAVIAPASTPEVTAIGGTQFNDTGGVYWSSTNSGTGASALGYIPETAWNEALASGTLAASGGGLSAYFLEPAWQNNLGVQSAGMRAVPDVALTSAGHDGYWIHAGGIWGIVGGTSAAAPSFAGMIALLNQYQVANGLQAQAGQGNINPRLYSLFRTAPSAFHDITTGDNVVPCSTGTPDCPTGFLGYSAGPGYDLVTGLGSVDTLNFITGGSVLVLDKRTSTTSGLTNGSCRIPPGVSTFTTASPQVWLYFEVSGAHVGDAVQVRFLRPDGVLYSNQSASVSSVGNNGYVCFSPLISIVGTPAVSYPGTWTIQTFWNQASTPLFSLDFSLVPASPMISSLWPSWTVAGGRAFTLTVNGSGFSSGAVVQWNGNSLATTFVSTGILTASVSNALIASEGLVWITVSSGGQTSYSTAFIIFSGSIFSSLAIKNQRVTTQAPPSSGCAVPPAVTSFLSTNNAVYLYFEATVTTNDSISIDWLAPDGSVVSGGTWPAAAGNNCFSNAAPLDVSNLSPSRLGNWEARVYDYGTPVFVVPFTVFQAGSLAHVVSGGTWEFTLDAINLGPAPAQESFHFFDNNGNPLTLPFTFPQNPGMGSVLASNLNQTLNPNAQLVIHSTEPITSAALEGWAQLVGSGGVNGFGTFSNPTYGWNAAVPLETRNASSYILAFDNTGSMATGLAIANVAPQSAGVNVIIRDDTGAQIGTSTLVLAALGHTSFLLNQQYPATAGKRGTVEFDTPAGGQISVLGLRWNGPAMTTLPVLAKVGTGGGSLAHATYNGGWTSSFYLVNTGIGSAQFTLSFFDNSGNPLSVPLSLPQTGTSTTTSALTSTLAAGAMLLVQTQAQDGLPAAEWSTQLTTTGNIGAFEIFRWTTFGQEASVPLETRTPNSFVLVFDDTDGLVTGVALANVANSPANIIVNVRDDTGALLQTGSINLAAQGHTSFMLSAAYASAANIRGMVEFLVPTGGKISVIGLRAKADGTLTTIPVLAK